MTDYGRLITLEGGEGAGKSTQARHVRDWLVARGRKVTLTREPGGSPLAEKIREVVLQDWAEGVSPQTELLLMFAARAAHLQALIEPALAAGQDVVCDRFVDSSYAYQGGGKGVAETHLQALERFVLGDLKPTLTLVLDLDPASGLQRARQRGEVNRFEEHDLAFALRVRNTFLARAARDPGRCAVIDAGVGIDQVRSQIETVLEQRL
ncbi:MAG: dTMP kinase [Nevskiales bacterium]|nr:dTMP kinase [Nevskiales bacterium]